MRAAEALMREAVKAMRQYYRAGKPGAPDVDGMCARTLWGARLRQAADAWARAEEQESPQQSAARD